MRTSPIKVELLEYMGDDISVVNAARVSFDKQSEWGIHEDQIWEPDPFYLKEADQKLINYLARNNHWTPFGHVQATLRIKAPIFVARQLGKHQVGLVWNEVSRRYVDSEPEFWFPKEWRGRAESVKQGSGGPLSSGNQRDAASDFGHAVSLCLTTYRYLLESGVCPEQARMVLPQNTMTEWVWTGSLAAFARVVNLRLDPHAQKECQEVAQQIDLLMRDVAPHSWAALVKGPKASQPKVSHPGLSDEQYAAMADAALDEHLLTTKGENT